MQSSKVKMINQNIKRKLYFIILFEFYIVILPFDF
jgi:hypothetical protein